MRQKNIEVSRTLAGQLSVRAGRKVGIGPCHSYMCVGSTGLGLSRNRREQTPPVCRGPVGLVEQQHVH